LKASEGSGNIPKVINDLRIRKLTPKECFRLMGVKDEDFEKVAKNQSDSSLYHLAGDSIVVNVLMAIFKEML
jgi:DNA (cytosine-5)-methyltransferase 1